MRSLWPCVQDRTLLPDLLDSHFHVPQAHLDHDLCLAVVALLLCYSGEQGPASPFRSKPWGLAPLSPVPPRFITLATRVVWESGVRSQSHGPAVEAGSLQRVDGVRAGRLGGGAAIPSSCQCPQNKVRISHRLSPPPRPSLQSCTWKSLKTTVEISLFT